MDWAHKPKENKLRPGQKADGTIVYADQDIIDQKYKFVKGCRYPVSSCYESSHYRKCCHICDLRDGCRWRCYSRVEDCQSKFSKEVYDEICAKEIGYTNDGDTGSAGQA